jgi:hypothetical protein
MMKWLKKLFEAMFGQAPDGPVVPPVTPPVEPPKPPEGHEIETIKVDGDGLWKPDTLTYLLPVNQRKVAPAPGWSANGQRIKASHIGKAELLDATGAHKGWLRWPGGTMYGETEINGQRVIPEGRETEKNYYGSWVRLLKARVSAPGDTIRIVDIYGATIAELRVPDPAKRAEGRR